MICLQSKQTVHRPQRQTVFTERRPGSSSSPSARAEHTSPDDNRTDRRSLVSVRVRSGNGYDFGTEVGASAQRGNRGVHVTPSGDRAFVEYARFCEVEKLIVQERYFAAPRREEPPSAGIHLRERIYERDQAREREATQAERPRVETSVREATKDCDSITTTKASSTRSGKRVCSDGSHERQKASARGTTGTDDVELPQRHGCEVREGDAWPSRFSKGGRHQPTAIALPVYLTSTATCLDP